jgi:nitroreductase
VVCIDEGEDERTARYAAVDAGAAIAQLTIEAVSRGLVAHPMAGFNADGACQVFGIPAGARPVAVVAIGSLGDYDNAPPEIVERDAEGRSRLPLNEVVFAGRWGRPLSL